MTSGPHTHMRVAVISDICLYREGLTDALAARGIAVKGTAGNGGVGVEHIRLLHPDIVLVDTVTPDSMATLRLLAEVAPDIRVIAIGVPEREGHVLACAEAGIAGYVPREGSLEDLVDTIGNVALGESPCSARITASLLKRVAALAEQRRSVTARLTVREVEIVKLLEQGLTNRQIANQLSIQLSTAKNHVHNILQKLQVERRGEAAASVSAELIGVG